ncbi:MAG TPA: hypothetical protein VIH04_09680 [Nitrosarchaeum sp.]
MFDFLKKKEKRPIPYTKANEPMTFVEVSLDELVDFEVEKLGKIVRKNIDKHIKSLSKLSIADLEKMRSDIKKQRNRDNDVLPQLKKLWAVEKQNILYSELERLFQAVDEELKKQKKTD